MRSSSTKVQGFALPQAGPASAAASATASTSSSTPRSGGVRRPREMYPTAMGRTRKTAGAAIAAARLAAQRISTHDHATPAEVVAHLGAVQAQDYAASKWAVGLRLPEG